MRPKHPGGTAGRLRLRQAEIILVIAVQCGLAATLAWGLAHEVAGRPAPVFAPSAAVGTIVAALGQRARRTAELMLRAGLGLLISDLLAGWTSVMDGHRGRAVAAGRPRGPGRAEGRARAAGPR